eukprot:TRINITY_DN102899_c0_g1_i1.p1 TRINITY_DN102899_c0_g1~~TRINITY_DN102899_c0_g1_i1.p1  ORF type:complete len:251 (+),score=10.75 TRINITY_DN102899_c0_g1_i1:98-850(+)
MFPFSQSGVSPQKHFLAAGNLFAPLPAMPSFNMQDNGEFPIEMFPPLPPRSSRFYWEPMISLAIVPLLIFDCCGIPAVASRGIQSEFLHGVVVPGVWVAGAVAALCTMCVLLGDSGEIDRNSMTCYPIPGEVMVHLKRQSAGHPSELATQNIPGMNGCTYCTRCLVWRPPESHHCSVCQRCVSGFDHHCSFFGRCITSRNMPCFVIVLFCLVLGIAAQGVTFAIAYKQPGSALEPTAPAPAPSPTSAVFP